MNNLTENLKVWREKRNITDANTKVFVLNTIEELLEIYFDDKDVINDNKDGIWSIFFTDLYGNDLQPIGESNTIDAIQDIQVFCINETELMGYDNLKCNDEVFKEIDSRVQCPNQMLEWREKGPYGKWKKSELQRDKDNWYKANYEGCKL
jgi:hypothetical protein